MGAALAAGPAAEAPEDTSGAAALADRAPAPDAAADDVGAALPPAATVVARGMGVTSGSSARR